MISEMEVARSHKFPTLLALLTLLTLLALLALLTMFTVSQSVNLSLLVVRLDFLYLSNFIHGFF